MVPLTTQRNQANGSADWAYDLLFGVESRKLFLDVRSCAFCLVSPLFCVLVLFPYPGVPFGSTSKPEKWSPWPKTLQPQMVLNGKLQRISPYTPTPHPNIFLLRGLNFFIGVLCVALVSLAVFNPSNEQTPTRKLL